MWALPQAGKNLERSGIPGLQTPAEVGTFPARARLCARAAALSAAGCAGEGLDISHCRYKPSSLCIKLTNKAPWGGPGNSQVMLHAGFPKQSLQLSPVPLALLFLPVLHLLCCGQAPGAQPWQREPGQLPAVGFPGRHQGLRVP